MEFSNKKHAYLIIAHNNWKQLSLLLSVWMMNGMIYISYR